MKKFTTTTCLMAFVCLLNAQTNSSDDKNVVISKCSREFNFVKGKSDHPVQIKEESKRVYSCKSYRNDVLISELYSDIENIDDVDIYVNDSKKTGITPKYDYYSADGI